MVNIARTIPGVVGERMLGGGDKASFHTYMVVTCGWQPQGLGGVGQFHVRVLPARFCCHMPSNH